MEAGGGGGEREITSCWVDYCLERELDERETREDGWGGEGE